MKIDIRFRGFETSPALREHVVRRIHFQLSRFGGQITAVLVRIGDINGPKGGVDKRCQVSTRGPAFGLVAIEDTSADAYAAVDLAMGRTARAIGREIERARGPRREGTLSGLAPSGWRVSRLATAGASDTSND